ncbi:MAG: bifunctional phosphopantothenoylcysteine decarboxylase/phosphopantothenate--cysteine ligase CoaBC [Clostridia bacterium]|nr:bifunctional phosphopantothenoylcysteine decarboxylase/phosphopantothenate--cysteine ligase CoaBC [Clostridia bacterium]
MAQCIVLGVTGGIAAYKSVEVVSRLRKKGYTVRVIMTRSATEFVTPLTFETLSGEPVVSDMFARPEKWEVEHIALAKAADLFLIAPATANIMAKLACGIADDMLSTTALATKAPILLAPAMNTGMWTAPATRKNLMTLRERGVMTVGPEGGFLACGDSGEGRMSEPVDIVEAAEKILARKQDLAGVRVMVTAGGTREYMDPVRYLGNESSGKMGFALAEAAMARGAVVTLVRGAVTAEIPQVTEEISVVSTEDLYQAVLHNAAQQDIIIQAAAPADYRFAVRFPEKFKKKDGEPLVFTLVENPDIAQAVGAQKGERQVLIGFAAETTDLKAHAREKLMRKNLDMIVANDVTAPGAGFNVDTNIVSLITENGEEDLPLMTKRALADQILDRAMAIYQKKTGQ